MRCGFVLQVPGPFSLPAELLTAVLRHVPQQQRLSSCALVSRTWHTAALAATTRLSYDANCSKGASGISAPANGQGLAQLQDWLQQHGCRLQSLDLDFRWNAHNHKLSLLSMQLAQLKDLKLSGLLLYSSTTPSLQAVTSYGWGSLTALTALQLQRVYVELPVQESIKRLTQLRRLQWQQYDHLAKSLEVLLHLTSLTHLSFTTTEDTAFAGAPATPTMVSLGPLTRLQELHLAGYLLTPNLKSQGGLPQSLTHLQLHRCAGCELETDCARSVSHLSGLRHLAIEDDTYKTPLDPTALSDLVQLTHLTWRCNGQSFIRQDQVLLQTLQQLSQLCHLGLFGVFHHVPDSHKHLCSALVSSSHLTHLAISGRGICPSDLRHMLDHGHAACSLRVLQLENSSAGWLRVHMGTDLASLDVQSLASSCPDLEDLSLRCSVESGFNPTALSQLTRLTRLHIEGVQDQHVSDVFLQLRGLQDLSIICSSNFSARGLMQLQQVTQLTSLTFSGVKLKYGRVASMCITSQVGCTIMHSVTSLAQARCAMSSWSLLIATFFSVGCVTIIS